MVKRIYREYLEGISLIQTGRGLEADDILTGAGKAKWRPETLKKILQNEKYIGDALLQKTYTVVFLNKKRVQNKGIVPQYYIENSHEPIIPHPVLYTARSVGRFTGGSHGITGESTPPCGGVVPAWSMDQLPVTHRPFRSRICKAAVVHSKKDYNSVADEIDRLRKLKQNVLVESAERKD